MGTGLDEVIKDVLEVKKKLSCSYCEEAEAYYQRVNQLCAVQRLVHDRHCRRIYLTLCELCKPEKKIMETRQATALLWQAWKGLQSNCGDATEDIIFRLKDSKLGNNANEKCSTFPLLLSLIESDINETTDSLSAIERALQQLRNDVKRERDEGLDVTTHRKALRRRQVQRALTVQLDWKKCTQFFEKESLNITESLARANKLQENIERRNCQTLIDTTSTNTKNNNPLKILEINIEELQQLRLKIKSHENAQYNLLSKVRGVRDYMNHSLDNETKPNFIQTTFAGQGIDLTMKFEKNLRNDKSNSLIKRAEELLYHSCLEGVQVDEYDFSVLNHNQHKFKKIHSSPALEAYTSRVRRIAEEPTLPITQTSNFSTFSGCLECLESDSYVNSPGKKLSSNYQKVKKSQSKVNRIPHRDHVELSYNKGALNYIGISRSDNNKKDFLKNSKSIKSNKRSIEKEDDQDDKISLGDTIISEDSADTTVVLSSECESRQPNKSTNSLEKNQEKVLHNDYQGNSIGQYFYSKLPHNEKKKLDLAKSKALVFSRLGQLRYAIEHKIKDTN